MQIALGEDVKRNIFSLLSLNFVNAITYIINSVPMVLISVNLKSSVKFQCKINLRVCSIDLTLE